jgi:hypothetical protein
MSDIWKLRDRYVRAYGELSLGWAELSSELVYVFRKLSGLSLPQAEAAFYSIRDDYYRLSLVQAMIPHYDTTAAHAAYLNEATARIDVMRGHRNKLIHNTFRYADKDSGLITLLEPKSFDAFTIPIEHIEALGLHINRIRSSLSEFYTGYNPPGPPALPPMYSWQPQPVK